MKDIETLPLTPDFECWPVEHMPLRAAPEDGALTVVWSDGRVSHYHAFLLAENDPGADTLHPLSREAVLSPLDLPEDLRVTGAAVEPGGAVEVLWSDGRRPGRFHPGWLRAHGWFADAGADGGAAGATEAGCQVVLWTGAERPAPPSFDGLRALADRAVFRDWLAALSVCGVARLEGLPDEDGLLMRIVERIGPVRESNFGRIYTLEIKDDPDSNAFTSDALLQHIDMPTRECPHGLQFLFCRKNTTTGGEGIYVDGYRVAEDLRAEEPEHFRALCEIVWTYNNRAKTTAYRASGPVIELDRRGRVSGIRYNTWLRAPLVAPPAEQDRAYRAYRAFARRAQDRRYQMVFAYRPGDLVAFDNRRALHGRNGYDAKGGARLIEGIYADRDDLGSALRALDRDLARKTSGESA